MKTSPDYDYERAATTLSRLTPRLERRFATQFESEEWDAYLRRLETHFPALFTHLYALYGHEYDYFYHLENVVNSITEMWMNRPGELKALDALRETDPIWYRSHRMVGAMCYVDLFAGDLRGLADKIPYLKELGITYLHLMPLFKVPSADNDGGYAVSDYRNVDPRLGTSEDLAEVAALLRHHGISLVLDFILNHTSDEHDWAQLAMAGNKEYQSYYRMFPDRTVPNAFERSMGDIFPDDHTGAFTYRSGIKRWVWTTFHNYQWDLNYENPLVFNAMCEEMLYLANQGVEVLRFDAVAFLWKKLGTNCQNLPQAHTVIRAFSAAAKIAAPAMALKSEAIVHPDEVRKYIARDECQLSYNPQLMALLWNSLATRETKALRSAMEARFHIPDDCCWVNYIRCHDDIGWAFADEDIAAAGFEPAVHRRFLTDFYVGRFKGSFARGLPFQENPITGDARVSGATASLTGLEKGIEESDETEVDLAIRRNLMLHGVIMTIGGIPLIYLGDEIATLNDYSYEVDPLKRGDTRWVHRPRFDEARAEDRNQHETPQGRLFQGLSRLVQLRQQNPAFDRAETEFVEVGNDHIFGYFRSHEQHSVLVLANFTEREQAIEARRLRGLGLRKTVVDMVAGTVITATQELLLEPYQFMVLSRPV